MFPATMLLRGPNREARKGPMSKTTATLLLLATTGCALLGSVFGDLRVAAGCLLIVVPVIISIERVATREVVIHTTVDADKLLAVVRKAEHRASLGSKP